MRIVVTTGDSERGRLLLGLIKCELGEHWVGTLIQSDEPGSNHRKGCRLFRLLRGIMNKTFSVAKRRYINGIRGSSILQRSVYSFFSVEHRGITIDRRERMINIQRALRNQSKDILPLSYLDSPGVKFSPNPNDPSVQEWLVDMKPDLILVFGGAIVSGAWLDTASFGIVNMHFGILPNYRCSWSTEFAIYQERWDLIGATIHYIDKGVDTGPIISIHPVEADLSEPLDEILAKVYWQGLTGLITAAKKIISGQKIIGRQVTASNSYYPSRSLTPWHKAVIGLRMSQRSIPWPKVQSSLEKVPASKHRFHISRFIGVKDKYPPGVYILLYHSLVDDSNNSEWEDAYDKVATTKKNFYDHIDHLLKYMTPLPLSEAYDKLWREEVDRPYFVITFDDGYANIRDVAPVLEEKGIRPCIFVNADFASNISIYYRVLASILVKRGMSKVLAKELNTHMASIDLAEDNVFAGTKNYYCYKETENAVITSWKAITGNEKLPQAHLSWDDLKKLHCMGWEIGNHTLSHPVLSGLTYEDVKHQIEDNHAHLIDNGLEPLKWISYPNGLSRHVDGVTEQWMNRNTDFHGIHAGGGVNFFPSRTEWLRIPIGNHSLDQFKRKVQREIRKTFSVFTNDKSDLYQSYRVDWRATISRRKLYVQNQIFKLKQRAKSRHWRNFPPSIEIEPTNNCNLNCEFCLVGTQGKKKDTSHHNINRGRGFMDFDLYKDLLKQAVELGSIRVLLHFQGESLLHPRFVEMVEEAKKFHLYCSFFTNGMLLNETLANNLVKAGLDMVRFSVDGASDSVYQQNRPGGSFPKVYDNMHTMSKAAQGSRTKVVWQFIAMKNNEHEIEVARELAKKLNVEFFVKSYAETDTTLAPLNPILRRKLKLKPCTDIYRQFCVYWDGRVVSCCYDIEGMHILGDLKRQSLKEIWTSKKLKNFHARITGVLSNPELEPEICRSCLKWGAE